MSLLTIIPPQLPEDADIRLPAGRIVYPTLPLLGFAAYLFTGFFPWSSTIQQNPGAASLIRGFESLPLFVFSGLLLLALQFVLSERLSVPRIIYLFVVSGATLVYAAGSVYFPGTFGPLFGNPTFYYVLEGVLLFTFIIDAVDRRRTRQGQPAHSLAGNPLIEYDPRPVSPVPPSSSFSLSELVVDFTGLTILLFISGGLLALLNNCNFNSIDKLVCFKDLHTSPYVPPFSSVVAKLPFPTFDFALGGVSLAVALILFGLIGLRATPQGTRFVDVINHFRSEMGKAITTTAIETLLSLRLTLSLIIWFAPAFALAFFSQGVAYEVIGQAQHTACHSTDCIPQLVSFWSNTANDFGPTLQNVVLFAVAIIAVILAVAVAQQSTDVFNRLFYVFGIAGLRVALTLAFFLLALTVINFFSALFGWVSDTPFEISTPAILSLLASAGFFIFGFVQSLLDRRRSGDAGDGAM